MGDGRETYPMALPDGAVLNGRYIVGDVLEGGGICITYKAIDHKTGEAVAVKEYMPHHASRVEDGISVLPDSGKQDDHFERGKEEFKNNVSMVARLNGIPGIAGIRQYFEENGTAYFVMDFLEGEYFQLELAGTMIMDSNRGFKEQIDDFISRQPKGKRAILSAEIRRRLDEKGNKGRSDRDTGVGRDYRKENYRARELSETVVSYRRGIAIKRKSGKVFIFEGAIEGDARNITETHLPGWEGIKQICSTRRNLIGIRDDGTIISTYGDEAMRDWWGMTSITAYYHIDYATRPVGEPFDDYEVVSGLRQDGMVLTTNEKDGSMGGWEDVHGIYSYSFKYEHIGYDDPEACTGMVGLCGDGRVLATGRFAERIKNNKEKISSFLHSIKAENGIIVGIKSDGTLWIVGITDDHDIYRPQVMEVWKSWRGIIDVGYVYGMLFGLDDAGKIRVTGHNSGYCKAAQCEIEKWNDVIQIESTGNYLAGLGGDGRVYLMEFSHSGCGQKELAWSDIRAIRFVGGCLVGIDGSENISIIRDMSKGDKGTYLFVNKSG